jgi:hypothetical protein
MALHGLVHGVVHHLKYQMMKTVNPGGSYIHSGAFSHRFQALEHLNVLGRII